VTHKLKTTGSAAAPIELFSQSAGGLAHRDKPYGLSAAALSMVNHMGMVIAFAFPVQAGINFYRTPLFYQISEERSIFCQDLSP